MQVSLNLAFLPQVEMASVRMHKSMDAAFNYDQHGQPKHHDVQMRWKQRAEYVQMIRTIEAATEQDVALLTYKAWRMQSRCILILAS